MKLFFLSIGIVSLVTVGCTKKDESVATAPIKEATTATVPAQEPHTDPSKSASKETPKQVNSDNKGETLYQNSCHVCHDTGNLGSPRMGDKVAWKDRIAQGNDVLYSHAINGFTGKTGTMPPKGTSTAPDSEIKQAVDYMVSQSK